MFTAGPKNFFCRRRCRFEFESAEPKIFFGIEFGLVRLELDGYFGLDFGLVFDTHTRRVDRRVLANGEEAVSPQISVA